MQYKIFEGNMERLQKKVNRIQNKCKKYGCEFHFEIVGDLYEKHYKLADGSIGRKIEEDEKKQNVIATKEIVVLHYYIVEAEGIAKISDWEFIGKIQKMETGNVIKTVRDACEVPERYYTCDIECEHCGTKHYRKESFLVRNTVTGDFKQVGRNCLCDYTHGLDAEMCASFISTFDDIIQGESCMAGASFETYYEVKNLLNISFRIVDKLGYVSRQSSSEYMERYGYCKSKECTSFIATLIYNAEIGRLNPMMRDNAKEFREMIGFGDDDIYEAKVNSALDWINGHEESSNYIHNLKVICANEYVKQDMIGILISLVPAYYREQEKIEEENRRKAKTEKEKADSEYVGNVGDKITIISSNIKILTVWENAYGNIVKLIKIVDTDGNVYVWKTTCNLQECDKELKLTGKVKDHQMYNDTKQTVLERVKVVA